VYGSGAGNVYIGDQSVSILANNGYIDLNCETHNAYDASGFCNGYVKSDDFPDLKPGKNHIAWSGAVDHVEITPRWWTL
jgi:phage-related protein